MKGNAVDRDAGNGAPRERPLGFGFQPHASEHHFVVTVPGRRSEEVLIAEHLSYDADRGYAPASLGVGLQDGKLRSVLARPKWDAIADAARVEFNRRLKKHGLPAGRWKRGDNPVARLLGKELTLLAWAVEDADPALIPAAVRNWEGLAPEERWWLYTMTAAATGHALHGRGRGWRKAVRYALTENPVTTDGRERGADLFQLVAAAADGAGSGGAGQTGGAGQAGGAGRANGRRGRKAAAPAP